MARLLVRTHSDIDRDSLMGYTAVYISNVQREKSMPSSLEPQPSQPTLPDPHQDNNQFWVAGIFYVNRNDPHLMVPKRSGLGVTFNFAHPAAWGLLGGLIVLLILLIVLLPRMVH
jgi:hypothetical protein